MANEMQNITGSDSYYPNFSNIPVMNEVKENLQKFVLEADDIIQIIEHSLKGEVFDDKKGKWVQRYTPILKHEAVSKIMSSIATRFNRNIILSDFERDDVMQMATENRSAIISLLAYQFSSLGIHKEDLDTIVILIDHNYYAQLRRALGSQALKALTTVSRHVETIRDGQQVEQKQEGFGKMVGGFLR